MKKEMSKTMFVLWYRQQAPQVPQLLKQTNTLPSSLLTEIRAAYLSLHFNPHSLSITCTAMLPFAVEEPATFHPCPSSCVHWSRISPTATAMSTLCEGRCVSMYANNINGVDDKIDSRDPQKRHIEEKKYSPRRRNSTPTRAVLQAQVDDFGAALRAEGFREAAFRSAELAGFAAGGEFVCAGGGVGGVGVGACGGVAGGAAVCEGEGEGSGEGEEGGGGGGSGEEHFGRDWNCWGGGRCWGLIWFVGRGVRMVGLLVVMNRWVGQVGRGRLYTWIDASTESVPKLDRCQVHRIGVGLTSMRG